MDIYEALQSGTSAEDLIKKFNTELMEAQKKIREDQKKKEEAAAAVHAEKMDELKEDLDNARYYLAEAILDYLDCYADYVTEGKYENEDLISDTITIARIEDFLKEGEKSVSTDVMTLLKLYDQGGLMGKKSTGNKSTLKFGDDTIIKEFLKSLK